MNANDYQQAASKFARYSNNDYPFLALSEEVGEVSGKLAKFVRKNNVNLSQAITAALAANVADSPALELRVNLVKELGDVCWQLAACCTELGFDLGDIMEINLAKLQDRCDRDVLVGEGDNR